MLIARLRSIVRRELGAQSVPQHLGAEPAQVLVEVVPRGHERQRLDASGTRAVGQGFHRTTGRS